MGPPYKHHVFVCENRRPDDHPRGSCAQKGSEAIRAKLKAGLAERGLRGDARANAAGCLDLCEQGPTVVVYPEGVWYCGVKLEDVDELLEEHLVNGRPVERLRLKQAAEKKPGG